MKDIPWKRLGVSLFAVALLSVWLITTPPGLLGKTDAVGYAVCHRISERSYHLGERPLSLCARCSGQYLGILLGLTYQAVRSWKRSQFPGKGKQVLFGGLMVIYLVDGINSALTLYPEVSHWSLYTPDNFLRLATGMGMGLALTVFLFPLANQVLWRVPVPEQSLKNWKSTLLLLISGGLLVSLVHSRNPLLLYPLTILSAAGVILLLSLIYTVIMIILLGRENTFQSIWELRWWAIAGFGAALAQVAALDGIRLWLTGTWAGF